MNNKKIVIKSVTIIIVIAALIWGSKDSVWAKVSPKTYVGVSIKNTYQTLQKEIAEKAALLTGTQSFQETASEETLEINIKDITGYGFEELGEYIRGARLFIQATKSNEQQLIKMNYKDASNNQLGGEVFYDPNYLGVKIDNITTEYLMVNLKNLGKEFNASVLRELMYMEEIPDDFSIDAKDKVILEDETYKELDTLAKKVSEKMEIKYVGKEKVNNKNCRKFTLNISEDLVKDFLIDAYSLLVLDKNFQEYVTFTLALEGYYTQEEIKEELKSSIRELKDGLKAVKSEEGLVVGLTVNNKQQLIKSESELALRHEQDKVIFNSHFNLLGKKLISDEIEAEVSIKEGGNKAALTINYGSNLGQKAQEVTQDLTVRVKDRESVPFKANVATSLNKKVKENNFSLSSSIDFDQDLKIKVSGEGTITEDKKSGTYTQEIDKLKVVFKNEYYNEETSFTLGTHYEARTVKPEDLMPSKKKDLFKMTEGELYDFITEIEQNMYNFLR